MYNNITKSPNYEYLSKTKMNDSISLSSKSSHLISEKNAYNNNSNNINNNNYSNNYLMVKPKPDYFNYPVSDTSASKLSNSLTLLSNKAETGYSFSKIDFNIFNNINDFSNSNLDFNIFSNVYRGDEINLIYDDSHTNIPNQKALVVRYILLYYIILIYIYNII